MAKKVLIGIVILAMGFALGGAAVFYFKNGVLSVHPASYAPSVQAQSKGGGRDFSSVVISVSPSVVNISTVKVMRRNSPAQEDPFFDFFNDFFGQFSDDSPRKWKEQNLGSGVLVSADGYIVTNNHVVADAEHIEVTLFDRRTLRGRVVGADPKTDIAIVKIEASGLPVIPWGDSDGLKVGEFVLAIGNPFGLNHTVTLGIISAVGRANVGIAEYEDFIQTDAAINPGNSGGPLVSTDGTLIGINTAIFSRSGGYQGIGFAVPSNMVRLLMEELVKEGRVVRGWLGVSIQELTPELSKTFGYETQAGALVGEVVPGSPAQKSGIRRGDIVLEYDGKEVTEPAVLKNLVARSRPGKEVSLKIFRNKKIMTARAVVTEPPKEQGRLAEASHEDPRQSAFAGLSVMELTPDISRQLGLEPGEGGVVVLKVKPGSPSEEAGLKRGDVIHEIDRNTVKNISDYNRAVSGADSERTALLYITRGDRKFYITVEAL